MAAGGEEQHLITGWHRPLASRSHKAPSNPQKALADTCTELAIFRLSSFNLNPAVGGPSVIKSRTSSAELPTG
jgi:hypothetical protein